MADFLTKQARSAHMARIRRANTKPELVVRSMLHRLGYRFRIQLGGVPGRPDVAFAGRHKAIFVHGCFWHAHDGCPTWRLPKTRRAFWRKKFEKNKERDARLLSDAKNAGWKCLVVWECETRDQVKLSSRLVRYLGPSRLSASRTSL